MERRGFLKRSVATGALAAVAPTLLSPRPAQAAGHVPPPGPGETRIIESAKRLKKNVDLGFVASSGPVAARMRALAADFKRRTGIGLGKLVEIPPDMLGERAMSEARARSGEADLLLVHADAVAGLASAGLAAPLDDYMKAVALDYASVGPLVDVSRVDGGTHALVTGGNCHTYVVRKDMLESGDNLKRYADKYGVALRLAGTWDEYLRQGKFFGADPGKLAGFGGLRGRRKGYWWFLLSYYNHGLFPFNDDLSPNFDNDSAEAALETYLDEKAAMPRSIDGWGARRMTRHFGSGKVYQAITWAGLLPEWENAKKHPATAGKLLYGAIPAQVLPDGRRVVRSIAAGVPLAVANGFSRNVDAAAHLAMFWASRRNSAYLVGSPPAIDHAPWRPEHFTDPGLRRRYTPAGMDSIALNMQVVTSAVRVTGGLELNDTLDRSVHDAWLGAAKPRQALKTIEQDWSRIIRRIDKDRLRKDVDAYRASMPKLDRPNG